MPKAGWFYPSFANSFTLCLIWLAGWLALSASLSDAPFFCSLACWVWAGGAVAVALRLSFSMFTVSPRPACLTKEKKGKKPPAVSKAQKKRSSRA